VTETIRELWNQGWVAENETEAIAQAERMFDLFAGKRVAVDRLMFEWDGELDEWMFREPWPEVWVVELSTESGWDGDVLLPEWTVRVADPDQIVTELSGKTIRLGDIEDYPTTTAPGIGTAAGFPNKESLVFPIALLAAGQQDEPFVLDDEFAPYFSDEPLPASVIEQVEQRRAKGDTVVVPALTIPLTT
jgi:hypothetical protein